MDDVQNSSNRRSSRSYVLLSATLESDGIALQVRLRNLSAEGALVEATRLPHAGEEILFRRNDLEVTSRVAWVEGKYAGIAFGCALNPQEVLRHIPPGGQKPPPKFWRPGIATRKLTPEEVKMVERWS